jgi:hypothetical protein
MPGGAIPFNEQFYKIIACWAVVPSSPAGFCVGAKIFINIPA